MEENLEVDSTTYLELEREKRRLAEVLFDKGVITGAALERERAVPQIVAPDGTTQREAAGSSS